MRVPMDKKQITLFLLVVFSFSFLGWQVYQLISSDIGTDTDKPSMAVIGTANAATLPATSATFKKSDSSPQATRPITRQLSNASAQPGSPPSTQQAYLELMHKLEVVRMQRRLFDEEAGIAAAKERIASLNHKTTQLSGGDSGSMGLTSMPLTSSNSARYQLAYLDQQNGHWSATVLKNNRYQQAELGSQLTDGSHVVAIDNTGVVLQQGDSRSRLTFSGLTLLPPPPLKPAVIEKTPATVVAPQKVKKVTPPPHAVYHYKAHEAKSLKPLPLPNLKEAFSVSHLNKPVVKPTAIKPVVKPAAVKPVKKAAVKPKPAVLKTPATDVPVSKPEDFYNLLRLQQQLFTAKDMSMSAPIDPSNHFSTIQPTSFSPIVETTAVAETPAPKIKKQPVKPIKTVASAPKKPKKTKKKPKKPKMGYSVDEILLLEMPPTDYTIHLKDFATQAQLDTFIKKSNLGEKALSYDAPCTGKSGKACMVLVYNQFKSEHAAQVALQHLPEALQKQEPTIAKLAKIQKTIKQKS